MTSSKSLRRVSRFTVLRGLLSDDAGVPRLTDQLHRPSHRRRTEAPVVNRRLSADHHALATFS